MNQNEPQQSNVNHHDQAPRKANIWLQAHYCR